MRQTLTFIIIVLNILSCRAQNPIISIDSLGMDNAENAYYKDINNDLDSFEGTWLYTNGGTSLKIILVKNNMFYNGDYYEDIMIGGYQYIENGVEKINTLSDANNTHLGYDASIKGNTIHNNCEYFPVDDCLDGEKRLDLSLEDVITGNHFADLTLHKRTINGQEALKARIAFGYSKATIQEEETIPDPTMPWSMNNVVLIKQ